jgi:hypothetical protein
MKNKYQECKRCGRVLSGDREISLGYCTSSIIYCDELFLQRICEHEYKLKGIRSYDDNEGREQTRDVLICLECKEVF